jgi:hypothetical protein
MNVILTENERHYQHSNINLLTEKPDPLADAKPFATSGDVEAFPRGVLVPPGAADRVQQVVAVHGHGQDVGRGIGLIPVQQAVPEARKRRGYLTALPDLDPGSPTFFSDVFHLAIACEHVHVVA